MHISQAFFLGGAAAKGTCIRKCNTNDEGRFLTVSYPVFHVFILTIWREKRIGIVVNMKGILFVLYVLIEAGSLLG